MKLKRARGEVRKLLIGIGKLQDLTGEAMNNHGNDRDPMGFEKGQRLLKQAFNLCIELRSDYNIVEEDK